MSINCNLKNSKNQENKMSLSRPANSMISYRTCFSSVSHHGYKLEMLKSGMQKYLRRREFEKMTWCVIEIFKFELWAKDDKERKMCKGIISNLLNRIIVMMDEELLFCEVQNDLLLRKFIEKFEISFAKKTGAKFALTTSSCTGALHLGLESLGINSCMNLKEFKTPQLSDIQKKGLESD